MLFPKHTYHLIFAHDDSKTYNIEIDVDELLDMESDVSRKQWLQTKLVGAKASRDTVEKFIDELLQRVKTL
ncbi:uncharacterized protein LOC143250504 isoform X2 [Tachypleus tridentatus]|uniref:uncharacterized protein LOC143250504 isoform X2 n=1 Tax=Tachypleus tridentatus TaxID=6853 RepID=UPI003FD09DBE